MKKVSMIVPVYNVECYLKKCLNSLLEQTFDKDDYEIICVNDCSQDKSQMILNEYQKKFPDRIKVLINEKNIGLGRTRDRAVTVAKGEYIMFVDSDDYVKNDYIETYYNAAKGNDIVIAGYIKDIQGKYKEHNEFSGVWSLVSYTIACAKMYRRKFIIDNQLKFEGYRCGEDIYFNLNAYLCKPKIEKINYAGYYYLFNPKSITSSMNSDKNLEIMIDAMFDKILEKHPVEKMETKERHVLEYVYAVHIANCMIQYNRGCGLEKMKKKYEFCFLNFQKKFPQYKDNPYYGFCKPEGESTKIRLIVGVMMLLHKKNLDKPFFYLLAMCPI